LVWNINAVKKKSRFFKALQKVKQRRTRKKTISDVYPPYKQSASSVKIIVPPPHFWQFVPGDP
jgi:flagellar biosynthesis/type III secretory pathway chaperone